MTEDLAVLLEEWPVLPLMKQLDIVADTFQGTVNDLHHQTVFPQDNMIKMSHVYSDA